MCVLDGIMLGTRSGLKRLFVLGYNSVLTEYGPEFSILDAFSNHLLYVGGTFALRGQFLLRYHWLLSIVVLWSLPGAAM